MAWTGKNHLENLEDILLNLQWLIQPDTVITELPYDIEFLKKSDVESFAEWCPRIVSKQELAEGRYTINKYLIKFFVDNTYIGLSDEEKEKKAISILKELHTLLNLSDYESINLNPQTISRIIDATHNRPGETHVDKTKKRTKVAVSLRWLQNKELFSKLSTETREYVSRIGDLYGLLNRGKNIDFSAINKYTAPPEDVSKLIEDYETKVELSLLSALQEIKSASKDPGGISYGGLGVVVKAVERLKRYIERRQPKEYDRLECFKDTIFIIIILNYVKDPYIHDTNDAKNVVKFIVPIYLKYKNFEQLD
ncbi:MAG: hypothetical protein ABIL70_03300 [candidate division WOR-3 bacterium]